MITKFIFIIFFYLIFKSIYKNINLFFTNKVNANKQNDNKIIDVDFEEIE